MRRELTGQSTLDAIFTVQQNGDRLGLEFKVSPSHSLMEGKVHTTKQTEMGETWNSLATTQ